MYLTPPDDFYPKFDVILCFCEWNGKVILLQRQKGKPQEGEWGVPAGKVNPGEPLTIAAKRELCEETGLDLPEERFTLISTIYQKYPALDFVAHLYKIMLDREVEIQLAPLEHVDYTWIAPSELESLNHMQDLDEVFKIVFPAS